MKTKQFEAKTPGSIMLMGEHAVLHGYPALVAAIDKHIHVMLSPHDTDSIVIHSTLGTYECKKNDVTPVAPFEFVLTAIKTYQTQLPSGFMLTIESECPDHLGLGSSAAVTVSTLSVLSQWIDINKINKINLLQKSIDVIRKVQGVGSGADACASIYGGVVYYKTNPLHVEPLSESPPISIMYSGKKESTQKVIAIVEKKRQENPEHYKNIFNAISQCCEKAKIAIQKKAWQTLGTLMQEHQTFMNQLDLNTPALQKSIDTLEQQDSIFGAKISGSGLGDCVVAIGHCAPHPKKILMCASWHQIPKCIM